MFTIPIESLDDWVREYQRDLMLNRCIRQPLLSEVDQFVKTDELGRFLRDKSIARLSGTLPKNDGNLRVWSLTIFDEFAVLARWLKNYTLGFAIGARLSIEEAIEEIREDIIKRGVSEKSAKNFLRINDSFWKKNEKYYENEIKKANKKNIAVAKKMLSMELSIEQISEITGLPLDDIQKLA